MNYKETLEYIFNLKGSEHKGKFNLSLNNIKNLLKKLKNPEKSLKIIHIAGTNGKGSVSAMVSSILQEARYKVGTYTSPHLKEFRERFLINNKKISEKDLIKYFKIVKKHITNQTFFEVITAMAFLYFKDKKIDFLVCEVGLGGRLDATNVIKPLVSVITNIGLEHKEYLGETIKEIAYEKAGIIKSKIPVITAAKGDALKVIRKISKKRHSELYIAKKAIKTNNHFKINSYKHLRLSLRGEFQLENASVAVKTIEILNKYYNLNINKNNLKHGLSKASIAGRMQYLSKNLLVDCAHNLDAIKALKKELVKLNKKITLIIGILGDKDYKKIIETMDSVSDHIILVKAKIPRALEPGILAKYVKKNYSIIPDVKKALDYAKKKAKKDELIVITGSIYVVREII